VTNGGSGLATVTIPNAVVVFRPGGTAGGNVYTTWASALAALALVNGKKTLQFDDSITSPIVLPTGSFDMTDTEWIGARPPNDSSVQVTISDGTSLPNLYQLGSDLTITNLNATTAPVVIPAGASVTIEIGFSPSGAYTQLVNNGAAPFFDCSAGGAGFFAFFRVQGRFSGTSPMVSFGAAAPTSALGNAGIILLDNAQIYSNMFAGTNGAQMLTLLYAGTTATFGNIASSVFAGTVVQPKPNGGFGSPGFERQWLIPAPPTVPSIAPLAVVDGLGMGTLLRFNTTAAAIAQTLPKIKSASTTSGVNPASTPGITDGVLISTGIPVTVKNQVGANDVNVSPTAGDTIEGSATPVAVPPGGSTTFVSDGQSNWIIIASYVP
jgi:hypothetical protein